MYVLGGGEEERLFVFNVGVWVYGCMVLRDLQPLLLITLIPLYQTCHSSLQLGKHGTALDRAKAAQPHVMKLFAL